MHWSFKFFFYILLLIYWERQCKSGEEQRGREKQSQRDSMLSKAWCGAWSHHPAIMTWAEIRSGMLNWLSNPDLLSLLIDLLLFIKVSFLPSCSPPFPLPPSLLACLLASFLPSLLFFQNGLSNYSHWFLTFLSVSALIYLQAFFPHYSGFVLEKTQIWLLNHSLKCFSLFLVTL